MTPTFFAANAAINGATAAAMVATIVASTTLASNIATAGDAKGRVSAATSPAAALYHNYCSVCHGDRGDGRSRATNSLSSRPRDFTSEASRRELSRERIVAAIRHGVPGTAMAAWNSQLSDPDVGRLADYLLTTFVNPAVDPRLLKGRSVYAASCSVCHGDKGQGALWAAGNMTAPPRDFRSPQAAAQLTRERMLASVTSGRPGTAMAAFGAQLPREDIEAVVDYIRLGIMMPSSEGISGTHAHAASPAPTPPAPRRGTDMSLPMPNKLTADTGKGKTFLSAVATCRGAKGDSKGPRACSAKPKAARNLTDEAARRTFSRPVLFAAISEGKLGTEMPAWKQVLSETEIANVTEYVFMDIVRGPEQTNGSPSRGK